MKIRYFKHLDGEIFRLRPKCQTCECKYMDGEWGAATTPHPSRKEAVDHFLVKYKTHWKEITEEDAMLEMI